MLTHGLETQSPHQTDVVENFDAHFAEIRASRIMEEILVPRA